MIAVTLIQRARDLGLQLEPRDGGRLAVRPASQLPPHLADDLRRHKAEILDLLTPRRGWQSVPPSDLPLLPLTPSLSPARRQLVIAYLSRQCSHLPLRDWLAQRKARYADAFPAVLHPQLYAHAAARDAACWQLDRSEPAVWSLLEGIESAVEDLRSKQVGKAGTHRQ